MERQYIIGLDEAGYGPNIGPLVIAGTVWSLPAGSAVAELWTTLDECVTNQPTKYDQRLHIADSKQVYQAQRGLNQLERSVLSLLFSSAQLSGYDRDVDRPDSFGLNFADYLQAVQTKIPDSFGVQPWYQPELFLLPRSATQQEITRDSQKLQQVFIEQEVKLEQIGIEVICPERFNRECEQWGNKSSLLSHNSLQLLRRLWPTTASPVLVLCDKHGGRNHYQEFLQQYFPEFFLLQDKATQAESRYRNNGIEFRFATRSEVHLPVAWASLFAKYTREICLEQFNRFWCARLPGLKPTKGYPQDAKRFRAEIESELQAQPEWASQLWRNR